MAFNTDNTTTDSFAQILFRNRSSNVGVSRIVSLSTASASTALAFVTEHSNTKAEKMRIASDGAIKFNTYGAGTLVTDSSGNITVSSGGGAGGPYLPLSAGSGYPLTGALYLENSNTDVVMSGNTSGNFTIDNNTGNIAFLANGSSVQSMTITSSLITINEPTNFTNGNVGIGTTSPNALLDVNGAGNFSGGTVVSGIDTNTSVGVAIAQGKYLYSDDGNYLRKLIGHNLNNSIDIGQGGTGLISDIKFFPGTSGNIIFYASGSENMRVNSTGNVGIGTTSPSHKFNVSSGNNTTAVGIDIGSSASFDFAANSTSGYTTLFYMDDTGLDIGHNSSGRSINFKTGGTDKLTILGGGNVGIGTTSPSQKLHLVGSARVTGAYYDSNNSPGTSGDVLSSTVTGTEWVPAGGGGGGISGTIANTQVAYGTGTDTIGGHSGLTYDGFGTLTATQIQCTSNLFVANGVYHYGDTNTSINFSTDQIDLYAGSLRMITCDESTNDEVIINENSADINFRVESNAYTHMFFVDGGLNRVGINQSVPSYTLDVNGDAKISGTIVDSTNSAGNNNDVLTSTGSGWSWQPASGGGGGIGGTLADDQVAFGNGTDTIAGSDDFAWNGNTLTLGGSTGTGNLSAVLITGDAFTCNNNMNLGTVIQHQGDTNTKFGFPANDTFTINTSGNESVRVDSSNNVGIGTGSVIQSKLDVKTTNTSQTVLRVEMPGSSSFQTGLIIQSSSASAIIQKFVQGISTRGSITFAGIGGVAYNTSSDYRIKENIIAITDGIERVKQLKPSRFNFIGGEQVVDGFIAHEVQGVIPEAIHGEKDETEEYEISPEVLDEEGNVLEEAVIGTKDKLQGIDQSKIVPLLTAALQEAIEKIETLETRIQTLENK
jgi:hypothetical protein